MACPSDFMPGKLTQQQVELRCGYYTEQCLQQLEQSPELAKLSELKKQERLAQQAKQAKAAILLVPASIHSACVWLLWQSKSPSGTLVSLNLCWLVLLLSTWSFCKASHSCQTPEKHPVAKRDPVYALHYVDKSSVPQAKYFQSQLGSSKTAFTVEQQHFADLSVATKSANHITR